MKFSKSTLATTTAALVLASLYTPVAKAEVAATVGIANMYYWRGMDQGNGDPQVSGDLKYTESGFYSGIWGGSGDALNGTEYDLYIGYGNTVGDLFKYDLSLWTYAYPTLSEVNEDGDKIDPLNDPGELSEAVLTLGCGPVSVTYMDNIAGITGYWYATVSATFDKFTILYGKHESTYGAHVDLSYAYSENLSFKIGKVVDDLDGKVNNKPKFIASYTLPLGK
jgi:uncharacterized protein (TIGR02001 family)